MLLKVKRKRIESVAELGENRKKKKERIILRIV
jgi:hypothetical protein